MNFLEKWRGRLARLSDERYYFYLLLAAAVIVAAVTTSVVLDLHRNFLTIACDTAAFQSALVNTLDGRWFRDTAYDGPNLLGLHGTFIILPLSLVYAIAPSVDTLFRLQVVGVWSALIPLYLIAARRLGRPATAFAIALTALTSPILLEMAWAPFHPETWILAAVLWSVFFYERDRRTGFWISLFLALCCGEEAGLIYATLGAVWFFFDDGHPWRKRYGLYAMVGGLGWIVLMAGIVSPSMHHAEQRNLIAYNYADWGVQSFAQLAVRVATHPFAAIAMLLNPGRWVHFFGLVGVPLALALFDRRTLPLLAPFCIPFLMANQEFFLYFHAYYFQFAFLAGYLALIAFLGRHALPGRAAVAVLGATLILNIMSTCGTAGFYLGLGLIGDNPLNQKLHQVFAKIPAAAGVYAPHRYSAYLSNRVNMVMGDLRQPVPDFNAMLQSKFATTDVRPDQIDYIVCDLVNDQCGRREAGFDDKSTRQRIANISNLVHSGHWHVMWDQDNVVILQRAPGG